MCIRDSFIITSVAAVVVILNKKLWESQLPTEMQMAREVSHGPMLIASGTRAKCGPRSLDRNLEKYGNLKSPIYFVTKKKKKGHK